MSFTNKCAVVTGAGSGIGKAVALSLANKGAKVALLDMNYEATRNVASDICSSGGTAIALKVNVTKKEDVFNATKEAFDTLGAIDHWVNCAGYSKIIPFLDHTEEIWDTTIDINLKGTFLCCQAAVTYMKDNGGTIVNFSSQSGKKGTNSYAAYCASKFGIIGLTQSVATEFAPKIRCNCICPSVVLTPMWDKQLSDYATKRHISDDEVMPRFIKNTPMGRLCEYEDVTNLVEFLLSESSSYITGQSLNLTGGSCMY
ncbi:MAG: SDR family oxidoreductase [Sphaerochaetaceae bacterium]|nr:SDR family oxidoreductase [Sphaerochaetaceae bacterium]